MAQEVWPHTNASATLATAHYSENVPSPSSSSMIVQVAHEASNNVNADHIVEHNARSETKQLCATQFIDLCQEETSHSDSTQFNDVCQEKYGTAARLGFTTSADRHAKTLTAVPTSMFARNLPMPFGLSWPPETLLNLGTKSAPNYSSPSCSSSNAPGQKVVFLRAAVKLLVCRRN